MKLVMMMSCIDRRPRCEVPSGKAVMLRSARAHSVKFRAIPKEA